MPIDTIITSKLISVFPTTSDELDFDEIEHAASSLVNDDDSLDCLSGQSIIIPHLELHENIDFTPLLRESFEGSKEEEEINELLNIEPIIIDFKTELNENDTETEIIEH